MTNEYRGGGEDDHRHFQLVQRASSIDSLELTDGENLRFISGYQQWINSNENNRVEKLLDHHHYQHIDLSLNEFHTSKTNSKQVTCSNEEEDEQSIDQMDISFDIHLQVNHGQLQSNMPATNFSSNWENINLTPNKLPACTLEMDMENGENHSGNSHGYSRNTTNHQQYNQRADRENNRANSNRNNNNSRRRSNDDDDDDEDEDDGSEDNDDRSENDDDDDDESDEEIARRLNFLPIDSATIDVISRLRNLTGKRLFEQQDFEIFQSLIDELIRLQHLETFSRDQLKDVVHHLKLHRALRTKSRAFIFLQERIPRRAVKYQVVASNQTHPTNTNVFNIWRERERRARLDSRDSLEDEGQNLGGQQLRDVIEINHPTPPVFISTARSSPNITTKVKQMAKDIDTRSTTTTTARSEVNVRTGEKFIDHPAIPRCSSPVYPGLVSVAVYDVKTPGNQKTDDLLTEISNSKRLIQPASSISPSVSEASHVRKMIDRLESSSTSSSCDLNKPKKITTTATTTIRKSIHDDHSDGSTSWTASPPVKRLARSDFKEKHLITGNTNFNTRPTGGTTDVKVEGKRSDDIGKTSRRTASGTTMEEYVTSLLPDTEASVSIVRDIRTRVYDDTSAVSRNDIEGVPVKVDVETLYILEQKTDKKSPSPVINVFIPDYEYKHIVEHQDFGVQTTTPTTVIKPPHRPIGTQVNSTVEQHTVGAQTTDSLHRPSRDRQRLPTPPPVEEEEEEEVRRTTTTTTTTRYEIKRRHSSYTSEDDDKDQGAAVIYIDNKPKKSDFEDNFQFKREKHYSASDEQLPLVPPSRLPFGQVASRIRIDQLRDINRHVVRRHVQENDFHEEEYHSTEVYEVHTRGACKCLVVSYEEKAQYGAKTRFEQQLERIERTYTATELKATELHVIVTTSDSKYQLVKRDYGAKKHNDEEKENQNSPQPMINIHYYTNEGQRMGTEHRRPLEQLPLVIRSEIEYELNHYGSAEIIVLSVTNNERRQINTSLKKELVEEIVSRSGGRLSANSPELEKEITRQLAEPTTLLHLVDYSSRDDYNQTNSTDLRRVSRIDVTTSLRLVQRYRTVIHRLCQLHRSHLRLTHQAEQQRHLILVARDEYYLLDLTTQNSNVLANIADIRQRQHDIFKREVSNVIQQPFDYAKYRRDMAEQQRILEQQYRQRQMEHKQQSQHHHKHPPPPGHPSEAEFYLGTQRRALIEREIQCMREAIRPHEHAPPRYKYEPRRRSLSISYDGAQRYVRARIIHVKDFYEDNYQQDRRNPRLAKEQELFVRVDDFINESAANSLRRSYSTDYLREDGPRSRIRFIRIPGETVKIEEKTTYEYKGVMYADLPYSLRYWNILSILDREARQGRPVGSTLPQVIVNDPYRTVIPPLTQQEIRQTAQQILSPQYNARSYTDQTLRWFLSRDNRTEIESAKYLQTLDQYHEQQKHCQTQIPAQQGTANQYYVTETRVHYEKLPDRLVPLSSNDRAQSQENLQYRSPSVPRILHPPSLPSNSFPRSQSQPRPSCPSAHGNVLQPTQQRTSFSPMQSPLSRHQSVHELYAPSTISHPPSPSPSLRSLHHQHYRRPVSYNNRYPAPKQNPLFTEIIDSQTGQRILTTSQEQLPSEVLGLLNKYNLQQF